MLWLLITHAVAALAAPALVSWLGRKAFMVLAIAPASAVAWALGHTNAVVAGEGPSLRVPWIPVLGLDLSFQLDSLSWLMVLLVGGIGAMVLAYSSRYFSSRSSGLGRFGAVLTAFAGAMLGLVTSANLLQVYVFWELTTVFSYLLIGHYADRATSRRAAMKAILVTTTGGLAMLGGIVLLGDATGTYDIFRILAAPPGDGPVVVAIVLLLVGAASKSALVPFHFWLPAAMAAPTPVSAYLHAAAMVKAGVYLVARLAPGFSTLVSWRAIIIGVGCFTMLLGGYRALRQHDLKLILAFGTVSQLGLLILLVGTSSRATALAGVAMIGAHAMFKASLFLIVGVIDAATGTRDLRQLSGLGRLMPRTAAIAALAVASMIGLPPLAGYVAKEAALESLLTTPSNPPWLGGVMVGAVALGSVLTVAYGLRLWWGAFATKRPPIVGQEMTLDAPPLMLLAPAGLLSLAGLATALVPSLGEHLLAPHAAAYPTGPPGHLTLWAGLTPAFLISMTVLAAGVGIHLLRNPIERWQTALEGPFDADLLYRRLLRWIDNFAADLTALIQRGSLPLYLGVILLVVVLGPGAVMIMSGSLPARIRVGATPTELVVGTLIVAATVLTARSRRRLKAIVLAGITGYGLALIFLLYGAPDLALTQVLVETVTLVVFVLVLRRLPAYFSNRPLAASRWLRLGLGGVVGLTIGGLALVVPQARVHRPVSELFAEEAVSFGGGANIVNVTLVDIRAWDTMGEIAVLLVAATGVASLLFISRRGGDIAAPQEIDSRKGTLGAADPDPMAALRQRRRSPSPEPVSSRSRRWLRAGDTLAPQRRSVILEVATRILYHTMLAFAVFLLFSGHNAPGGGFAAGLVTGIALMVRYLAGGRYELSAAAPLQPGFLLGSGMFLSAGVGLGAMLLGGEVLQSVIVERSLPLLGEVKLVTSVFFDIGVFLVVIGLILDILRSLGAEIDRQGERTGFDSDLIGPALEPAAPATRRPE
ncbi:MAG TPA: Na+/H+ antiporter subunit A [Acidimicrobiia bacterium]|nr:Na+/H+ antiporter subunit A [Acidimicrobiia bacterium]